MVRASSSVQLLVVLLGMLNSSCTSRIEPGAIAGQVSGASDQYFGQGVLNTQSNILAIPNANINIKNASTGVVRTIQTDFSGNFRAEGIPPGRYEISFAAKPFEPQVRRVDVRQGKTIDASTRMLISREAESIVSISGCPAGLMGGAVPSDLGSAEIQMRRTPCYGPCPVYSIHLRGDGRVEYQGDRYVSVLGIRKYRVAPSAVVGLAKKFFENGFFNFCASYRQPATDMSAVETKIQLNGVTKTVFVYGNAAPAGLEDLDMQIEDVAGVAQLVKSTRRPASKRPS